MEKFKEDQLWKLMVDINNKDIYDTCLGEIKTNSIEKEPIDDLFDEHDISTISFSLDNEKILEKINDIITNCKNIDNDISLKILKNQNLIATYLSKYVIQNNILNYDFFIKLLNWLMLASNTLAKRLKMDSYSHDLSKIPFTSYIPRCSYKFCSFKDTCNYNYDNKMGGCYADHYVHNMVHADIEALECFTQFNSIDNKINHSKEIIKCVSTISYVIRNMYDELKNICINNYNEFCKNHELFHRNRKANMKHQHTKNKTIRKKKINKK